MGTQLPPRPKKGVQPPIFNPCLLWPNGWMDQDAIWYGDDLRTKWHLIQPAIWPQQTWVENWGAVPFWGRGAGSPSNTMWPGPRPTCMPTFILIRQTVWSQYTNVTDKTERQTGQLPDSIGKAFYKWSPKNYMVWATFLLLKV